MLEEGLSRRRICIPGALINCIWRTSTVASMPAWAQITGASGHTGLYWTLLSLKGMGGHPGRTSHLTSGTVSIANFGICPCQILPAAGGCRRWNIMQQLAM